MKSYKRAAEDKSQLQQFTDEATAKITELEDKSPLYVSKHLDGEFEADDMEALATGKYCGLISDDSSVYILTGELSADYVIMFQYLEGRLFICKGTKQDETWDIDYSAKPISSHDGLFIANSDLGNLTSDDVNELISGEYAGVYSTTDEATAFYGYKDSETLVLYSFDKGRENISCYSYSYDSDDDEWSFKERYNLFSAPKTYTQLYLHSIYFNCANVVQDSLIDDPALNILIISNRSTAYTLTDLVTGCQVGFNGIIAITCEGGTSFVMLQYDEGNDKINASGGFANSSVHYETITDFSDTVTPL